MSVHAAGAAASSAASSASPSATPSAANPAPPTAPPRPPPPPQAPGVLALLQGLWQELPGLLSDRVELLSLELERARDALMQIAMLTVAAAVLGVTSWLLLWAGVVMGLQALGLPLVAALLLALGVNLLSTWWVVARARALLPRLGLPATRRHLLLSPAPQTSVPAGAPAGAAPGSASTGPAAPTSAAP